MLLISQFILAISRARIATLGWTSLTVQSVDFLLVIQTGTIPESISLSACDAPSTPPHTPLHLTAAALLERNATTFDSFESLSLLLMNARAGRQTKLTAKNDSFAKYLRCEGIYVAPKREMRERFEVMASKANAGRKLSVALTCKGVHDHYNRPQARVNVVNELKTFMSNV